MTKKEQVGEIKKELLDLKDSSLLEYRRKNGYLPVVGEGSLDAEIVFVGEAPGKSEALTGRPFAGAAGKILDGLLGSINLSRQDIFISNLVNDRPPANRVPTRQEIELYSGFLDRLITIIKPKVIATLGRLPMKYLLEKYELKEKTKSIGELHGKALPLLEDMILVPLYHPASVFYNRKLLKNLEEDFLVIKNQIQKV